MSERESLMAAIKAKPAEDTPRLIYADWLDEYAESDLDRAQAEFIRLSCTMAARKSARPSVGKWLDKNVARLVPTLAKYVAHENGLLDAARASNDDSPQWNYYIRSLDRWEIERDGRNLLLRQIRSGSLPEMVTIEFWRGFVRKVLCRHWHMMDRVLPLLLVDQPLVEPGLTNAVRDASYRAPPRSYVYSGWIGRPAFAHLPTEGKYKPSYTNPIEQTPYHIAVWVNYGDHAERARWACAIAFRKAAEDVMAGKRKACEPMGMPASPIADLGGEA